MAKRIVIGGCVKTLDGRIGRVREKIGDKYKVRVRRIGKSSNQFVFFKASSLIAIDPPKGWMSVGGYQSYLQKTLNAAKNRCGKEKKIQFLLPVIPPFRLDLTIWALRRRERNILDNWDGHKYIRILVLENTLVKVQIEQVEGKPKLLVKATSKTTIKNLKTKLSCVLNHMLGLNIRLDEFYELIQYDKLLNPLATKFKGVKPPCFPTLFEAFVNAILCQQLSLEAALSIENRFLQHYGEPFKEADKVYYAFPDPCDIAKVPCEELMKLGFSRQKGNTLIQLAAEICNGAINAKDIEAKDILEASKYLTSFKGIGIWSSEYILLRGFRKLEVIPGDDVAVQKNIQSFFNLKNKVSYQDVKKLEKKWLPYAGFLYFHFLLQKLSENTSFNI